MSLKLTASVHLTKIRACLGTKLNYTSLAPEVQEASKKRHFRSNHLLFYRLGYAI